MGIHIKGNIELPPHCFNCSTKVDPDNRRCNVDGHIFEETLSKITSRRDDLCPLSYVPPHGRLIDADKKIKVQLYDDMTEDYSMVEMTIDDLLSQGCVEANAPTIIPAEEEGET